MLTKQEQLNQFGFEQPLSSQAMVNIVESIYTPYPLPSEGEIVLPYTYFGQKVYRRSWEFDILQNNGAGTPANTMQPTLQYQLMTGVTRIVDFRGSFPSNAVPHALSGQATHGTNNRLPIPCYFSTTVSGQGSYNNQISAFVGLTNVDAVAPNAGTLKFFIYYNANGVSTAFQGKAYVVVDYCKT